MHFDLPRDPFSVGVGMITGKRVRYQAAQLFWECVIERRGQVGCICNGDRAPAKAKIVLEQ